MVRQRRPGGPNAASSPARYARNWRYAACGLANWNPVCSGTVTEGGALKAAREAEIATLLVGHAGVQQIYNAVTGSAVHAVLQLRILDAPSGGVLAQERGEANVEDAQTGQASALALEQAVLTVVPRLMPFLSVALRATEPGAVTTP